VLAKETSARITPQTRPQNQAQPVTLAPIPERVKCAPKPRSLQARCSSFVHDAANAEQAVPGHYGFRAPANFPLVAAAERSIQRGSNRRCFDSCVIDSGGGKERGLAGAFRSDAKWRRWPERVARPRSRAGEPQSDDVYQSTIDDR